VLDVIHYNLNENVHQLVKSKIQPSILHTYTLQAMSTMSHDNKVNN